MESCNAVGRTVCIFPYAGMTRIRLTGEGCDLPSLSRNGSGPPKIICSAVEGILQDFPEKIKTREEKGGGLFGAAVFCQGVMVTVSLT